MKEVTFKMTYAIRLNEEEAQLSDEELFDLILELFDESVVTEGPHAIDVA